MKPLASSVTTIWWTEGGVTWECCGLHVPARRRPAVELRVVMNECQILALFAGVALVHNERQYKGMQTKDE